MRIVARLLVLLPLLWVEGVWAEDCPETDYTLTSQAEVDALGAIGCSVILGSLRIEDSNDITDLDTLSSLTHVGRQLVISDNTVLANVDGLASLTIAGTTGGLIISGNDALANLHGLTNITSLDRGLSIDNNPALKSLDGIPSVSSIGDLTISYNASLADLNALVNVTNVEDRVIIQGNHALTSLAGLDSLTSVGDTMWINHQPALSNLNGLANLSSVEGDLMVVENSLLGNLDGLASLTSVGGYLSIRGNLALTDIDGLANVTDVGEYLYIAHNPSLRNVNGLARLASIGGRLALEYNAALTNLDGLANLSVVGGGLTVLSNDSLSNVDGLGNLTHVPESLRIGYNAELSNVGGLANVNHVGDRLTVNSNGALSDCKGLTSILGWPSGPPDDGVVGEITIRDNGRGCNSVTEIIASVPIQAPSVPTITSTDFEDGKITLTVSVSNNGGAEITGYNATCSDGTNTYTGTSTSSLITVSGLTNGVAYTCTVTATNSVGTSSASAATDPITPEESTHGLPIWLLYTASESISSRPRADVLQDGVAAAQYDAGIFAFDQALGYGACGGGPAPDTGCESIAFEVVDDPDRGSVLEISYLSDQFAGIVIDSNAPGLDMSGYETGVLKFDIKVVSAGDNATYKVKLDDHNGGSTGEFDLDADNSGSWATYSVNMSDLLVNVDGNGVGGNMSLSILKSVVFFISWGKTEGVVFRLDNVYFQQ